MKQRNLILLFCAVLLMTGCTEKKQNHMKSSDFEVNKVLKDSMPEPVKMDSVLLSDAGTVVPYFPGGLNAMRAFVAKHVRYPEAARLLKKEGRVIISAQVDTKGNLSQYKVMMSDDPLFDKEALRVVKLMPRFVPEGKGKVVAGTVKIPVMFRLK
nr:energy transducer TonB [Prevotella sp.]